MFDKMYKKKHCKRGRKQRPPKHIRDRMERMETMERKKKEILSAQKALQKDAPKTKVPIRKKQTCSLRLFDVGIFLS
jgi:hypothetical protein